MNDWRNRMRNAANTELYGYETTHGRDDSLTLDPHYNPKKAMWEAEERYQRVLTVIFVGIVLLFIVKMAMPKSVAGFIFSKTTVSESVIYCEVKNDGIIM